MADGLRALHARGPGGRLPPTMRLTMRGIDAAELPSPAAARPPASKLLLRLSAARRSGLVDGLAPWRVRRRDARCTAGAIGRRRAAGERGTAARGAAAMPPAAAIRCRHAAPAAPAATMPPAASRPTAAPAPSCGPPETMPLAMPGPKMPRPSNDKCGQHHRHRVFDRRLVAAEPGGELREQRRADADDDGEHQHLDAGRDDVAEHAFGGMNAVLPNRPNGISTKPASVVSLNSIRVTKSWIARMKKASSTTIQANSSTTIWTKFSKKLM